MFRESLQVGPLRVVTFTGDSLKQPERGLFEGSNKPHFFVALRGMPPALSRGSELQLPLTIIFSNCVFAKCEFVSYWHGWTAR